MSDTLDFLTLGGPLIPVISFASIVATAIVFERAFTLQARKVLPPRFLEMIRTRLQAGRIEEANQLCASNDSPVASILASGLRVAHLGRVRMREAMEDRGRREATELERFLGALAAIATVSPLLGLLGTITGMIQTFQQVTAQEASDQMSAGVLATGIWEALITTAAGLCVAIPTFLAHRYLVARVDRFVNRMEEAALDAIDLVCDTPPSASAPLRHNAESAAAASPQPSGPEPKNPEPNNPEPNNPEANHREPSGPEPSNAAQGNHPQATGAQQ